MGKMRKDKGKKKKVLSFNAVTFYVGLFGGLLWGGIYQLCHYLNFTEVGPTFLIRSWMKSTWSKGWLSIGLSMLLVCAISILLAFLYAALFRKVQSCWMGIGYGVICWLLVFFVLRPIYPGMKTVEELSKNTIVTTLCLFILYGLFVGYSISFEYFEEQLEQKDRKEKMQTET